VCVCVYVFTLSHSLTSLPIRWSFIFFLCLRLITGLPAVALGFNPK
jgi:hypothetical protein